MRVENFQKNYEERHIAKGWTNRELKGEEFISLGQTQAQKSKQMHARMKALDNQQVHNEEKKRAAVRKLSNLSTHEATSSGQLASDDHLIMRPMTNPSVQSTTSGAVFSGQYNPSQLKSGAVFSSQYNPSQLKSGAVFSSQHNPSQLKSGFAVNSDRVFPNVAMSGDCSNPKAELQFHDLHSSRKFSNFPSAVTGLQATSYNVEEKFGLSKEEKKVTPAFGK